MKIKLKSLAISYFKGIKSLTIPFNQVTTIYGANATGKSSIADSWFWLLFGKNQSEQKDFNIKTLGLDGEPMHRLDHEVVGELDIDGSTTTIKRVYREKWVKKRGEEQEEFSGHETVFFWNDVPLSQKEFQEKVSALCPENVFKLITSTSAFANLHWQDRRKILFDLAGEVKDSDIAAGKKEFEELLKLLNGKTLSEFKKEVAAKKRVIKEQLTQINPRVDEIQRSKPEPIDVAALNKQIADIDKEILEIDESIADSMKAVESQNNERARVLNEIHTLKGKVQTMEFNDRQSNENARNEASKGLNDLNFQLSSKKQEVSQIKSSIENMEKEASAIDKRLHGLRELWTKTDAEKLEFKDGEFDCPACKRPLDDIESKKEEMTASFNVEKAKKLDHINKEGVQQKEELQGILDQIEVLKESLAAKEEAVVELEKKIAATKSETTEIKLVVTPEIAILKGKISELEASLAEAKLPDNSDLKNKKADLVKFRDEFRSHLTSNDQIEKADARIKELLAEEKKMAQELANLEKQEFVIEGFTKAKIGAIEDLIASKFEMAKFRMFQVNINGGIEEACDILYNGVPYQDLNTASRINVALDIINALCKHYQVWVPIFIDNREAVTDIIPVESQVVNFIVSPQDKVLRVE